MLEPRTAVSLLFLETVCDWTQIHHASVGFMFVLKLCKRRDLQDELKCIFTRWAGEDCNLILVLCSFSMLPMAAM